MNEEGDDPRSVTCGADSHRGGLCPMIKTEPDGSLSWYKLIRGSIRQPGLQLQT